MSMSPEERATLRELLIVLRDVRSELRTQNELASQQHVCGHGTRGWCPHCTRLLLDGRPVE